MIPMYYEIMYNGNSNPTANSTTQIELQLTTFEYYLQGFKKNSIYHLLKNSAPSIAFH